MFPHASVKRESPRETDDFYNCQLILCASVFIRGCMHFGKRYAIINCFQTNLRLFVGYWRLFRRPTLLWDRYLLEAAIATHPSKCEVDLQVSNHPTMNKDYTFFLLGDSHKLHGSY